MNARECYRCNGTGTIMAKVGWRPNPKDKVGYLPPIIEYGKRPCPECSRISCSRNDEATT